MDTSVSGEAVAPRYTVIRTGDVVQLQDAVAQLKVSVFTPVHSAYEVQVKGQDLIRKTFASADDFKTQSPGMNGIPLLWPYANRLDEQAFYANGTKYTFDTGLGNTGGGAIPIHGYVQNARDWKVVEAKADATGAWITSTLDFYRDPKYMKQFPFAHTLTITYRVSEGALEVRTTIDNMSREPMPVSLGFHPYFQLTDSTRADWTISVGARTHWKLAPTKIPTGETEPIEALIPNPASNPLEGLDLDDVVSDLEPDARDRATVSVKGKRQQIDVTVDQHFKAFVLYSPHGRDFFAIEPMAGITDAMNLAQKGLYKELQSAPAGGTWTGSFWIKGSGY